MRWYGNANGVSTARKDPLALDVVGEEEERRLNCNLEHRDRKPVDVKHPRKHRSPGIPSNHHDDHENPVPEERPPLLRAVVKDESPVVEVVGGGRQRTRRADGEKRVRGALPVGHAHGGEENAREHGVVEDEAPGARRAEVDQRAVYAQ